MGKGKNTGEEAAGAIAQANLQGINELRRQFDATQENVQPFIEAGTGALPDVQQGATIEGFGERLRQLFSGGSLDPLIDERTERVTNQQAALGTTRSGAGLREIADIPAQLGIDIENLIFGRQSGLSSQGLQGGLNLGSLGSNMASSIANLFQNTGQARSSGIVTDAQAQAAGLGQAASAIGTVLPVIASFFSDPNLKENVEEIGEFKFPDESLNLKVYQWDWIPEAQDTIVAVYPRMGCMSDEVREKYPQFVQKYAGFDVINYRGLLDHLEMLNQLEEAA